MVPARLSITLVALALLGCQASPVRPAVLTNPKVTTGKPGSPLPAPGPVASPGPGADLGLRSTLAASIVANNGGALSGRVSLPASLIGNHGGNVLSNGGGSLLGKAKFGLQAPPSDTLPLAGVTVVIVDAAGRWVPDPSGAPYTATTDAQGAYRFDRTPTGANFLLQARGATPAQGTPTALLPAVIATTASAARTIDVDALSTLTMGYITARFVQGTQAVLDRLPADVEEATRQKLARAVGAELGVTTLAPEAIVARVDTLRQADVVLDAQVRFVESLLVAGLSNLGEGLPATEVSLSSPDRLAVTADGTLYVVEGWAGRIRRIATDGRIFGHTGGRVVEFDAGGEVRIGDGGPAREAALNGPRTAALDAAGNLYVCDWGVNRIRRIDAKTGTITTVAGARPIRSAAYTFMPLEQAPPPAAGARAVEALITSPHAVAVDAQGRCIFACLEGTYRIESAGTLTPLLHDGKVATPSKLASGPDGQVFAWYPSGGFGRLVGDAFVPAPDVTPRSYTRDWHLAAGPGGVLYLHGDDDGLWRWADGTWKRLHALEAVELPTGLTANATHVWISSSTTGQVWRYTLASGTLERVAGIVVPPGVGLRSDQLSLNRPAALAFDAQGRLLVADGFNGVIWRRDADGLYRRVAGNGASPDAARFEAGVPAATAAIGVSTALLPDADGTLRFSAGNQTKAGLFEVDAAGALRAVPMPADVNPMQVARDARGAWLVSDTTITPLPSSRVLRLVDGRVEELVARKPLGIYYGLLPAPDGSLYYTDVLGGTVHRRTAEGRIELVAGDTALAGTFAGDGGPATKAGLSWPFALARDAAGHLYLADSQNHRVRRIDARTGVITTLAGAGGLAFTGSGADNGLREPGALAFDATGNLTIADSGHNQIKQVPAAQLPR